MTLWTAQQVCGECGEGHFRNHAGMALCTVCDHEHPMDPWNLDSGESFQWIDGSLYVVAVAS